MEEQPLGSCRDVDDVNVIGDDEERKSFEFAFNSEKFSDHVLRIEVMQDDYLCPFPASLLNGEARTNRRSKAMVINASQGALKVHSLHVNSAVLAFKSEFFFKFFSNGMSESDSDKQELTVRINASEEEPFMELMNFIYTEKLTSTSPVHLLNLMMVADKFSVSSCTRQCREQLRLLPMTKESALMYLELAAKTQMTPEFQSLIDAAKEFFIHTFGDIDKSQNELMSLTIDGIESVFSIDKIQVPSENTVCDFLLKWARQHYPNLNERREILQSRLGPLIRFEKMTSQKLVQLINTCNEPDNELSAKFLLNASSSKLDFLNLHREPLNSDKSNDKLFSMRAYTKEPGQMMEFDHPVQQCVVFPNLNQEKESCFVYLNLNREDCASLYPSGHFSSKWFQIDQNSLRVVAYCNKENPEDSFVCFSLYVETVANAVPFEVYVSFHARKGPSGEFERKKTGLFNFSRGKLMGWRNIFGMPWEKFIAEDSRWFINGVLHLRAKVSTGKFAT